MEAHTILSQLGFDEKEIKVYFAALELGIAPMSVIARKAKLKRPTAYQIMKKLIDRGLGECFLKNKMRYYGVNAPSAIYDQFERNMKEFKTILPQMMAVTNKLVRKPKITFYEGKEDVRKLYLDVLTAKVEALNYFLPDKPFEYFGEKWVYEEHIAKRIEKGIRLRVLMPKSYYLPQYNERSKQELREIRVIENEKMIFTNEVFIYDDKMSTFSFDEDFGLLIQSKDVIQAQRVLFELAWESRLVSVQ